MPDKLNISIIRPILKDLNKPSDDVSNLRPISISNCFAQILEKILAHKCSALTESHKNQFGFKPKTSCQHAIFTVKETILNYIEKNSSCKIASLDAEKAFDKVWRAGLFYKLKSKVDHRIWLILKKYYDSSVGIINDNQGNTSFSINCGVKEGGILSPAFINIYVND